MNIQTLENQKAQLQQELAAKKAQQRVESDLAQVEEKIRTEQKRRYSLRQDWLNRMKSQQQKRLKAEAEEKEILAEINRTLEPLARRLLDVRTAKTQSVIDLLGIFESENKQHNFDRVGTAEHFHSTMREMGVDICQFPKWAIRKRLFGDFFQSKYTSANVGPLALAIDTAVEAMKK